MVQPTAPVDNMNLLQHTQSGTNNRSVCEDENLPIIIRWVFPDDFLKPVQLLLIDVDLVRGVWGIAERSRSQAHEEGPFSHFVAEVRGLLPHQPQVGLHICLIGLELIDSLEIVVTADDVILHIKAVEKVTGQLEAGRGSREDLLRLRAILGLTQVSQRDEERVDGLPKGLFHVLAPLEGVVQIPRVQMQIPKDSECEDRWIVG
mmetsp:Transcript_64610/g.140648  ORF Transcript_64610/g.140648 Transcript_64610/m.140648 type:complete len:204 (+) Transcript_64610:1132-1743(+)